jgi:hypothetical protein
MISAPGPPPPRSGGMRAPVAWMIVGAVIAMTVVGMVVTARWVMSEVSAGSPRPAATAVNADRGAEWAGFPITSGLEVLELDHSRDGYELWKILWTGEPQAMDEFLAAGGFTKKLTECYEASLPESGATRLAVCRRARDRWRRPDGAEIDRIISRGSLPDGTEVMLLAALDPE